MGKKVRQTLLINAAVMLSAILNAFESLKRCIIGVLENTKNIIFTVFGVSVFFLFLMAVFMEKSVDTRIGTLIIGTLLLMFVVYFATCVIGVLTNILSVIFYSVTFDQTIIDLNAFAAKKLNAYIEELDSFGTADRILLLPVYVLCYVMKAIVRVSSMKAVGILFAGVIAGRLAYVEIFVNSKPPVHGEPEFFLSWLLVMICIILAVYCLNVLFATIRDALDETGFGLFQMLEMHLNAFQNKMNKNKQSAAENAEMDENSVLYSQYHAYFSEFDTAEALKKAYREKAKEFHPDNQNQNYSAEDLTRRMSVLNTSYYDVFKKFR